MKLTRAGACRVKDRDIKRGNRAATVKNQMIEASMWTDFNIGRALRMLFNTVLWTWGQKALCRNKHLLTLCSENVKHSLCFRRASILHGRGKLHNRVSGQAWPPQSLGYRGFLLSEVVLPNRVGGKAKQPALRSQVHGEFSSLTSAHLLWFSSFILAPSFYTLNFTSAYLINSTANFVPFSNITLNHMQCETLFLGFQIGSLSLRTNKCG